MSKSRKHRERKKQKPPRPPLQKRKRVWSLASKLFAAILTFCTLLGAIVLWPRVTIEAEGQIDPSNPYPISFKISNTGFVPLRNMQPFIGVCGIWLNQDPRKKGPSGCGSGALTSTIALIEWEVGWFARDETTKIRLDDLISGDSFGGADISVGVRFNIWKIPWLQLPIEYRFETRIEPDGKLSWIPRPLNK